MSKCYENTWCSCERLLECRNDPNEENHTHEAHCYNDWHESQAQRTPIISEWIGKTEQAQGSKALDFKVTSEIKFIIYKEGERQSIQKIFQSADGRLITVFLEDGGSDDE